MYSPSSLPPAPATMARRLRGVAAMLPVVAGLLACSPTLDWREVRPPDTRAQLLMPCKPSAQERRVMVAGQPLRLTLLACAAGDITWGLASADVGDPARMGQTLQALLQASASNLTATTQGRKDLLVPGATPHAASQWASLDGRLPDGKAVSMQTAVFAHGTRAFQATALGSRLPAEQVQTFMASIRFAD